MSYRDEKDIGPSREELTAAKLPFGLIVVAIVMAFVAVVVVADYLFGSAR